MWIICIRLIIFEVCVGEKKKKKKKRKKKERRRTTKSKFLRSIFSTVKGSNGILELYFTAE